jgi:hypothetical protein
MVLVRGTDTICTIQKINHLLYRLERTDTKNQFSKKNIVLPPPRSASRIRQREEAVVPRSGRERRRRSASWSPRWGRRASVGIARGRGHQSGEGGRRWAPLILVVTEVGKEGVGGSHSSSWSLRWGRRVPVGATRPHGRRGGEGGRRWEPLVLMVIEVGKEGVGGRPSWSWSPRWGRRASVGDPRVVVTKVGKEGVGGCRSWSSSSPSGPKLRAAYRLCLAMPPPTASTSPCRRLPPPPRQAQRPPCRRLPRRLSPHQNQRKERRERTE